MWRGAPAPVARRSRERGAPRTPQSSWRSVEVRKPPAVTIVVPWCHSAEETGMSVTKTLWIMFGIVVAFIVLVYVASQTLIHSGH